MVKLRAITLNALQETLRRRVLYIVLFLLLIVLAMTLSQFVYLRMARTAGETQIASGVATQTVQGLLGIWNAAAFFLALFLGAIGISTEITSKTIIHILSRPIDRGVYLLGRWLGLLIFLGAFFVFGSALALLVAALFHVAYAPLLWLGFLQNFVELIFLSGLGLAFSVFLPPIVAGGCALLLMSLPGMVGQIMEHPNGFVRGFAHVAYYLGPARAPGDLVSQSFSQELLHTPYATYVQVMLENSLYAAVALVIAAFIFKRREVRVR